MRHTILQFYIPKRHTRNTGIGKLLIQTATAYAISKDCGALELTSMIQNINAHRFYENNGFEKRQYKFKKSLN